MAESSLLDSLIGTAKKARRNFNEATYFKVPAQYRTFIETLLGNRDKITEDHFSTDELNLIRKIAATKNAERPAELPAEAAVHRHAYDSTLKKIRELQKQGPKRYDFFEDRETPISPQEHAEELRDLREGLVFYKKQLDQDVRNRYLTSKGKGYVNYYDYRRPAPKVAPDDPRLKKYDEEAEAIATTLGSFRYDLPNGKIIDTYDFSNSSRDNDVKHYNELTLIQQLKTMAERLKYDFGPEGSLTDVPYNLASEVGNAWMDGVSRPVDITLPTEKKRKR